MPRTAFAARGICGFGLCGRAAWEPLHRFQSTRPVWGATWLRPLGQSCQKDFNPRAPCGARQHLRPFSRRSYNFNPRAPCGARLMDQAAAAGNNEFQSTRPVWGATIKTRQLVSQQIISIHAPRVGRDDTETLDTEQCRNFNPRAPCGARPGDDGGRAAREDFNPRAPCGARPNVCAPSDAS